MTTHFHRGRRLTGKALEDHVSSQIEIGALVNFIDLKYTREDVRPVLESETEVTCAMGRYLLLDYNASESGKWKIYSLDRHEIWWVHDRPLRAYLTHKYNSSWFNRLLKGKMSRRKSG